MRKTIITLGALALSAAAVTPVTNAMAMGKRLEALMPSAQPSPQSEQSLREQANHEAEEGVSDAVRGKGADKSLDSMNTVIEADHVAEGQRPAPEPSPSPTDNAGDGN